MKLSDRTLKDSKFMGLFKGEPKTGKSIGAATWPKPMYIFDIDGRWRSILASPLIKDKELIEIDTFQSNEFGKVQDQLNYLLQNPRKYKTIIMDSVTSLADMLIEYSIGYRDPKSTKMKTGSLNLTDISDFNTESKGLGEIINFGRAIPCNFILIAHVLEVTQNRITGEVIKTRTLLTAGKKVAAKLPAYFDEVWHFANESQPNVALPPNVTVLTRNAGEDFAGTIYPLPTKMDITNRSLYDVFQARLKEKGIEL